MKTPRPTAGVKPPKARPFFLRPPHNIGLDIAAPSRVVLVVEKTPERRNHQPCHKNDSQRTAMFLSGQMAAGRASSGTLTSRDRKSERLFSGSHRFYKKRSMSETSSKVEIEQTPAGTGLLFRLSHKVEIPCEEAPLTSLERESPKWTTS